MDNISWLNKLNLGDDLLKYIGDHYFKHLILVKMMNGSGVDIDNIKSCDYNIVATGLEINLRLKKPVNVQDIKEVIECNLNHFEYNMNISSKNINVIILDNSKEGELYSHGNIPTSYA